MPPDNPEVIVSYAVRCSADRVCVADPRRDCAGEPLLLQAARSLKGFTRCTFLQLTQTHSPGAPSRSRISRPQSGQTKPGAAVALPSALVEHL